MFLTSKAYRYPLLLLWMLMVLIMQSCNSREAKEVKQKTVEVRGIYGHPGPFWEKGIDLSQLGVNAIFVHSGSIDSVMVNRARRDGLLVYAEFATLNGKNYVDEHPEAWAVNDRGEMVEPASWFMGVCPTDPGFRQYRMDQLQDLLGRVRLDGVWMDYVHWHAQFEEPEPILPETCFCDHCLTEFSGKSGLTLPGGTTAENAAWILENHDKAWRDWRCRVILEWALDIREILDRHNPEALLGLYHCPWKDSEYDSARRRILGLDYDLLRPAIDVFSPMVYHRRMGRKPEWVGENIRWFSDRLDIGEAGGPRVWPIVQAYNDPGIISTDEFRTVLEGGLDGASTGVMMFTTRAVAGDSAKTDVMKSLYQSLMKESD